MTTKPKILIDVVSDVMCPWCYIGKVNLQSAINSLEDVEIETHWRPYQLDPTLPKEGRDRRQYLETKFGGKEGADQIYDRIRQAGSNIGIDFRFEDIEVSPNTMDAHRTIHWAGGQSPEIQDKLVERLFQIYFLEGGHLGDDNVLASAAESSGMDGTIVKELLASDSDRDQVQAAIDQAQKLGITGVPCFIIDRKYALMGAQPPEQIVQAIRQALTERNEQATSNRKN